MAEAEMPVIIAIRAIFSCQKTDNDHTYAKNSGLFWLLIRLGVGIRIEENLVLLGLLEMRDKQIF